MGWQDVINGTDRWSVEAADCLEWFASLPPDSIDLVFGSPPYRKARTYGINFKLADQAWVDWMVAIYKAALRCCRGLVAFVIEGQTKNFRWTAEPAMLMADLHRAGVHLRKPPAFHRVGIAGSGGPDWLRNDYEFIICATRGGKLPWSQNTACGHPPKWAPGGEMSHRTKSGKRVNDRDEWGSSGHRTGMAGRYPNGEHKPRRGRRVVRGSKNGDTITSDSYRPPKIANPGNVLHFKVGGGLMGHKLAHKNEAPFPLGLAEFFVRSFCPPDGIVADNFLGSGTTLHAAAKWGRRFIGCDLRQSQVEIATKRINSVTPMLAGAF